MQYISLSVYLSLFILHGDSSLKYVNKTPSIQLAKKVVFLLHINTQKSKQKKKTEQFY